jgi:hypothetical protein
MRNNAMSTVTKTSPVKSSPPPARSSAPAPAAKPASTSAGAASTTPTDKVTLSKEGKEFSERASGLSDTLKSNYTDSKEASKSEKAKAEQKPEETKASEDRVKGTDTADDPRAAIVPSERLENIQNLEDRRRAIEAGQAPEVREQHLRIDAETDRKVQDIRNQRDEQLKDPESRLEQIETQYQVDVATAKADGSQRARVAAEKIAQKPEGRQSLADMDSLYELEQGLKSESFQGNREEAQAKAKELREQLQQRGINYPTDEQLDQHHDKWRSYYGEKNRDSRSTAREPWASPELTYAYERRRAEGSNPETKQQNLNRIRNFRDRSAAIENGEIARISGRADEEVQRATNQGEADKRKVTRGALQHVDRELGQARQIPTAELPDHLRNSEAVKRAPEGTEFSLDTNGELVGTRYGREVSRANTDGNSVEMTTGNTDTLLTRTENGWDEESETTGRNGDFETYERTGTEELRHSRTGDTTLESYRKDGKELERTEVREQHGKEVYRQEFDVEEDGREVTTTTERPYYGAENHQVDTRYTDGTRIVQENNRYNDRTIEATTVERDGHTHRSETETHRRGAGGSTTTRNFQDGEKTDESTEIRSRIYGDPNRMVPDTLFNNSPQDMMERLGPAGEITSEQVYQSGSNGNRTFTRHTNKDGSKQITYTDNRDGMSVVEYSEKTDNGSRSQTFFQGTPDTVVSETKRDGKWETTTTDARYDELSKYNKDLPQRQNSVSRSTDEGTAADLQGALSQDFSDVTESDSWKAFQNSTGAGDLKIVSSQVANDSGQSSQVIAEAGDGRRFMTVRMPNGQVYARTENPDGTHIDSVRDENGNYHSRGNVAALDSLSEQRRDLQSGTDYAAYGKRAAEGAGKISSEGWSKKPVRTAALTGLDTAFDSASLVFNGIGMAADLEDFDKNRERIFRRAADMGMDLHDLVKGLGKGGTGSRLASSGNALARGLGSAGRLAGSATKLLGKASGFASGLFAAKDLADGNYVEAGLGGLSTAAFFISGPVGWGVGALAFAGSLVWESDKADQIADAAF